MPDWMKDLLHVQMGADDDGAGGAGGGSDDDGAGDGKDKDDTGLKTALDKERDARKAAEQRAKAAEKERDALKTAGQTDAEKAAAERDAAKARADKYVATVRTANGREAVRSAAKEAGAPDPDLIYRLVKADIDFDDDDEPTNVDRLVMDIKKEYPDQFKVKPGKADAGGEGAKGAPKKGADMNAWIRAQAGR